MPQVLTRDVESLRAEVAGQVLVPQDPGYDDARAIWNGGIDRHPTMVLRPAKASDISAAIAFAREHDLELSVRGGAHAASGVSVTEDGLEIDLSSMRDVTVDPVARRALVGGGATLLDRDAATQEHGLATTGGIVGHTGVGGLTLGGGMGWLTRKHGLSLDNLLSAEVVVADGRVLRASKDENPDLFWAIRGGGGNFGVVTQFEFQLHPVGPMVDFGMFFWPLERGAEVLRLAKDLFENTSRDVNAIVAGINAPPEPFVPQEHWFRPGYALLVTGIGTSEEHAAAMERIRAQVPPLFELVAPMPYAQLQQMFDEANAFGFLAYDKCVYVDDLSEDVISVMTEHLPHKTSPLSPVFVYRLDGAYCDVGEDDTAFGGGRTPRYAIFLIALADNPEMFEADRRWLRSFWAALLPYATGIGSYVNGEAEFAPGQVRDSYGRDKYERLCRIKAKYDPENAFHLNANIPPINGDLPGTT
ncbi:MAG: FAD-binding oxidoreductase [Nocardioidaceae bacterium]